MTHTARIAPAAVPPAARAQPDRRRARRAPQAGRPGAQPRAAPAGSRAGPWRPPSRASTPSNAFEVVDLKLSRSTYARPRPTCPGPREYVRDGAGRARAERRPPAPVSRRQRRCRPSKPSSNGRSGSAAASSRRSGAVADATAASARQRRTRTWQGWRRTPPAALRCRHVRVRLGLPPSTRARALRAPRPDRARRRVVADSTRRCGSSRRATRRRSTSRPATSTGSPFARAGQLYCEWKGTPHTTTSSRHRREAAAAWTYPSPCRAIEELRDHIAFYPGRMDACWLDDERVQRPGGRLLRRLDHGGHGGPVQGRAGDARLVRPGASIRQDVAYGGREGTGG